MTQSVNYEKYKNPLLDYKGYFIQYFGTDNPTGLNTKTMNEKYNEYNAKHISFNRDNFECQCLNEKGVSCNLDSPITLHHYKHKSNGGKWAPRNCVTVCRAHQSKYHNARDVLMFANTENIPPHIRGTTQARHLYVLNQEIVYTPTILTKEDKSFNTNLRKNNKKYWGRILTFSEIAILLNFLFSFKIQLAP